MDGIQFSAQDFYRSIEDELAARDVPRLNVTRVEYHEGSLLSDKRIYLRLARERLAFDVCAAPFGKGYFFSLRFVELPRGGWLKLAAILAAIFLVLTFANSLLARANISWAAVIAIIVFALFVLWGIKQTRDNSTQSRDERGVPPPSLFPGAMPDFDSFFLNLPIIGEWCERYRKDTYYRHDTRLMYLTLITEIVKKKVEEVTAAKGVMLLRGYEYNPIFGELYKPVTSTTGSKDKEP